MSDLPLVQALPSSVPGVRRMLVRDAQGAPVELVEAGATRAARLPQGGVFSPHRVDGPHIVLGPPLARPLSTAGADWRVALALAARVLEDLAVLHASGGAHLAIHPSGWGFDAAGTFQVRPCLHLPARPGTPSEADVAAVGECVAALAPSFPAELDRVTWFLRGLGVGTDRVGFSDARAALQALRALLRRTAVEPALTAFLDAQGARMPSRVDRYDVRSVGPGQVRAHQLARDRAAAEARAWVLKELERSRQDRYRRAAEHVEDRAVAEVQALSTREPTPPRAPGPLAAALAEVGAARLVVAPAVDLDPDSSDALLLDDDVDERREASRRFEEEARRRAERREARRADASRGLPADAGGSPDRVPTGALAPEGTTEAPGTAHREGAGDGGAAQVLAGRPDDATERPVGPALEQSVEPRAEAQQAPDELAEAALAGDEHGDAEGQTADGQGGAEGAPVVDAGAHGLAARVSASEPARPLGHSPATELSLPDGDEAEPAAADPSDDARAEAERVEAERVEAERVEAERVEAERVEAERVEAERIQEARREATRIEAERIEAERIEAERIEAERVEAERVEAERIETARREAARIEAARIEAERIEAERTEADRIETARREAARIEAARIEAARIEAERVEAERIEAARIEAERIEAARREAARIEAERIEAARVEAARAGTRATDPPSPSLSRGDDRPAAEHTDPGRSDATRGRPADPTSTSPRPVSPPATPHPPAPDGPEAWEPRPTEPGVSLELLEEGPEERGGPDEPEGTAHGEAADRDAAADQGPRWSGAVGVRGDTRREREKGPGKWVESGRSAEELRASLPEGPTRPLSLDTPRPSGPPLWLWIVGAGVLLAALAGLLLRG